MNQVPNRSLTLPFATAFLLGTCPPAFSGDLGKAVLDDKMPIAQSSLCDLFDHTVLYENESFLPLQKFAFTGRLQADATFFEADQGEYDSLEWRRVRAGFKSQHFDTFGVHVETDLDLNDSDPVYRRLTEANLEWSPGDELVVKIGKQGANFTLDGSTSSTRLYRMERSLLSTNVWFTERFFTGATASGEIDGWIYQAGLFSSDAGTEFSDFESGNFALLSIGYDFAEAITVDQAVVRLDYVHHDPTGRGVSGARNLSDVVSLNATIENGPWGLRSDLSFAEGIGTQSDLAGIAIMPTYDLSEEWQLVASYNYVTSDDLNGVRLDRYENRIVSDRADEAHEFYFGVNRYLCGHKLKWQAGVEYTTAEDAANDGGAYDGWGVSSGIRISW
jgi:phosphate-selective porin OprO and OprP